MDQSRVPVPEVLLGTADAADATVRTPRVVAV